MAASGRGERGVLVLGASSGIGRATAHVLAARGDRLVLASRGREPLLAAAEECRARGAGAVRAEVLDVRDAGAVEQVVGSVADDWGVDAVVHAAAVMSYGRFEDVPVEVFDALVATNVLGPANVARAVMPRFRAQGHGHLVLIGSVLGEVAAPGMTPYVVSKWAVRSLAHQLQLEGRDRRDVHVTLVAPWAVDTPIFRQAANYQGKEARPPLPIEPERVAAAVAGVLERPRPHVSVGRANVLLRAGFTLVPFAYNALVGPFVNALGTSRRPAAPTAGNVLAPQEELESVHATEVRELARAGGR